MTSRRLCPAPWRGALELLDGGGKHALIAVGLSATQALLLLPVALIIRHLFDVDVPRGRTVGIIVAGLLVAACYAANAALMVVGRASASMTAKVAMGRIRHRLVARLQVLPLSWHDRHETSALHATVVEDCERVDRMVHLAASQVLPATMTLVALAVVACIINLLLFAVVALFVPAMLLGGRAFTRQFRRRLERWHTVAETFSDHTHVLLGRLATIRAAGADLRDLDRFGAEIELFTEAGYSAAVAGSRYQAIQGGLAAVAGVCVLIVGGILVAHGHLRTGDLLAFYSVVALMLRQLSTVVMGTPLIVEGAIALGRVQTLAQSDEPGAYRGTRRIGLTGRIEFDSVAFTYGQGDREALRDLTLRLDAGEHVCILGPNGAGKTTLLALILGLYRPHRGVVRIDGVPLEQIDLVDLRQQFGVVLQTVDLFAGTIEENVRLSAPDADDDALWFSLRSSTADELVATLPEGLKTRLGDGGSGLSGGQRQRIAIARAILGRPAILLLDEPTAHLSSAATLDVIANLVRLPWDPTIVVITHDVEIADRADRVIHLEAGRLSSSVAR